MNKLQPYLKAIVGFVTPGAVLIGAAVLDTSQGNSRITTAEWVTALVACIVTAAAVERTPNKDPQGLQQQDSVQPPDDNHTGKHEAGAVDVILIVCVAILLGVVLLLFGQRF